jgi:hypothetical protein
MAFLILIIFLSIIIPCLLIGLFFLFQNKFDNKFLSLLVKADTLKLLVSNQYTPKVYKKIKIALSIQTLLIISLATIIILIFKSPVNLTIKYLIIILMFLVRFVSNKFILNCLGKEK